MANVAVNSNTGAEDTSTYKGMLDVNPFNSLLVHFGMLLGVEDFNTLDAYHRGKMWLHSAWLHREGTLWGLQVSLDHEVGDVRVSAGMALDKLGRELYLDNNACSNLVQWYVEHMDDPDLVDVIEIDEEAGTVTFDAHVTIEFKGCLARQVPAISEPCDGANSITAYSRVVETVELRLVPGPAPEWRTPTGSLPFHRLRLLFGLEEAIEEEGIVIDDDQDVLDARQAVLTLPAAEQPAEYLKWFRHFSALDEMEMEPAKGDESDVFSIFPGLPPSPIPLANLTIELTGADTQWEFTSGEVNNVIRPVHVPTSTIQELLCGPLFSAAGGGEVPSPPPNGDGTPLPDAGGPRIDPESVSFENETIRFNVSGTLMKASADARAISVTSFDTRDGWISSEIKQVDYDASTNTVKVELRDNPGGNLLRLIVRGTGEYPFLGRNKIPLAGAVGGPPGTEIDGNDFVSMLRIRS